MVTRAESCLAVGFNPCVGRNSSGAHPVHQAVGRAQLFQSVCWSE